MKTNTVRYSVSIPDIHKILSHEDKDVISPMLSTLSKQGVRLQDPIAELEGRTIFDHFLFTNRSLIDIKTYYASGITYDNGRDSPELLAFKAAFKKRPEVFSWLISDAFKKRKIDFNPNAFDSNSRVTPYFIAASSNLSESMSALQDIGVDVSLKNRTGQTVLQNYLKFTRQMRKKTVEEIFKYCQKTGVDKKWLINEPDDEGHTPLMTLIFRSNRRSKADKISNLRSFRYFLDRGANPSHQDNRGYTPLMWVAIEGDANQMALLLEHNANPSAFNNAGDSALTLSVIRESEESVKCLLNSGVDPNDSTASHPFKNPLLIACQNDSHEIALDLLEYNADPNISNGHHDNHTPLIYSIKNGNRELVSALIRSGADPDRENNHGMTPLMYAIYNFRDDPVVHSGIIEDLINSGASLSKINNKGTTASQLVSELSLEIKIGKIMYDRNLDYIAANYFGGDIVQAKKHLINENSDVFELLHTERIESSDHMITFMKEKSDHIKNAKMEMDRDNISEGYRLINRSAFVLTPSVTAISATVDNLMKTNGNSTALAATAGVAAVAAYLFSFNTDERMKIRMAIDDAKQTIDNNIITPLRDTMIRGYITSSLFVNEKLDTLIGHWEWVSEQISKFGSFLERAPENRREPTRSDLVNQLGEMLTEDQIIELIDAIQSADSNRINDESLKIRGMIHVMPERDTAEQKFTSLKVEGHNPSHKIRRLKSNSGNTNDF